MVAVEAPQDRNGFKVAIICALPLEAEMVELVLDKDWQDESKTYGKALRDPNAYTTGVIGQHNVVLAYMPGMGSNSAASVASGLRSSFPEVDIAFVVGICGVVPFHPQTNEEIVLGDCVISTTVVQYDFGKEYPLGFKRKQDIEDSLGRATPEIRAYISKLTTRRNRQNLTAQLISHLELMQQEYNDLRRPASNRDRLYEATYRHQHHTAGETCNKCLKDFGTCTKDCDALRCEDQYLITRKRLQDVEDPNQAKPKIHFGRYGTANTVMKSGERRDKINAEDDITAFEMEGSGVWDTIPTIIIKAACDYADSHKTKEWQPYAAATAAACLKAVLQRWEVSTQILSRNMANMSLQNQVPPPLPPREIIAHQAENSLSKGTTSAVQNPEPSSISNAPTLSLAGTNMTFVPPKPTQEDYIAMNRELVDAAQDGDYQKVMTLHRQGANLDAHVIGSIYPTALQAAAQSWKTQFDFNNNPINTRYPGDNRIEKLNSRLAIIKYLLSNGADWNSIPPGPTRTALLDNLGN